MTLYTPLLQIKSLALCVILICTAQLSNAQNTYNSRFRLASLDTSTAEVCYDLQLSNTGPAPWRLFGFNINIFYDASLGEYISFGVVSDNHVSESAPVSRVLPTGTIANSGLSYDSIGYLRVNVSEKIQGEGEPFDSTGEWISIIQLCYRLTFGDIHDPSTCFILNFDTPEIIDASIVLPDLVQETDPDDISVNLISDMRQDLIPDKTFNTCFILDEDTPDLCGDGIDNDEDGLLDCMDTSCGPGSIMVVQSAIECFNPLGSITIEGGNEGVSYSIDGGATFLDTNIFELLDPDIYDIVVIQNGINACAFANPVILQAPMCNEAEEADCMDGIDNDGDGFIDCEDDSCLPRIDNVLVTLPTNCPSLDNSSIEVISVFPNVEYSIDDGMTFTPDPIFSDLNQDTFYIMIRNMNTMCAQAYDQNPIIIVADTTCVLPDEICADGIDNDFDGLLDCLDQDCRGITACINVPSVYIPNILSVNSANNNVLTLQSEEPLDVKAFNIFDRWGNNVYSETQSAENIRWDGTFRGFVRTGVYVYHLQIDVNGSIINQSGDITVVN